MRGLAVVLAGLVLVGAGTPAAPLETGSALIENLREPWTGDFNGMAERRSIRVLAPFSKTFFFVDGGTIRGHTAETLREFERHLNKGRKAKDRITVKLIPTPRNELLSDLVDGRGDIAIGNLTITEARRELVDFSDPFFSGIKEFVITGKDVESIGSIEDISGQEIHVRESSSYYESLEAVNAKLADGGRDSVKIVTADERLEDEDLIEMVQAGLIPAIVVDSHKAAFWKQIFPNIHIHDQFALREDGEIAWAFRKQSPELSARINAYAKTARAGTSIGNTLMRRYFKSTKWLKAVGTTQNRKKLDELERLFRKYGKEYQIDWLLIAALSYQESNFDQSRRNRSGAVGLMQIKPSTAADPNVGIKGVSEDADKNVHAGVKYLRFVANQYFADPQIDDLNRIFMTLGAYNAGPNRVARQRKKAENPNVWFGHVEWAVAARAGMEPVKYVSNILKYYVFFKNLYEVRHGEGSSK